MYNEILDKLNQFPKLERTLLILICRMCTEPGIKVRSFFNVIEQLFSDKRPYVIQNALDGLLLGGWIEVVGDELKAIKEYDISDVEIENDQMSGIVKKLVELTTVARCDELLSRIPYMRMGFSLLQYYKKHDNLRLSDANAYGRLAVNIARNIGLTGSLGDVCQLYDLPIYKILEYARMHVDYNSSVYARICLALASIHNSVLEFDGCHEKLETARKIAISEGISETEVEVFIAKSDMLLNQGLFANSLANLKLAWDTNILLHGEEGCVENIEVGLKIANICLILHDKKTCQQWLGRITHNLPTYNEFNIFKILIDAGLQEEPMLAEQLFDEAELISWRLYGYIQPEIHKTRSIYLESRGRYEEADLEYMKYSRQIRSLYGFTTNGDLAISLASRIMTCIHKGAIQTAAQLNCLAIDLCPADGPAFSFGSRVLQYLSIGSVYCYSRTDLSLACSYAEAALELIRMHIKMSDSLVRLLAEIFDGEEKIPALAFAADYVREAFQVKIDVAIAEERYEDAISLCNEFLKGAHGSSEECFIWASLGYVYGKVGNEDGAINAWTKAAETSGEYALEIAADTAWMANDCCMLHAALDIINKATEKPVPNSSNYLPFLTFASICSTAGIKDQEEKFFSTARKLAHGRIQRTRCLYYQALELQDIDAIKKLEKAILCPPDSSLCVDEELAFKFKNLAENKHSWGDLGGAKKAAAQAVRLYPANNPDFYEEIEDDLL